MYNIKIRKQIPDKHLRVNKHDTNLTLQYFVDIFFVCIILISFS